MPAWTRRCPRPVRILRPCCDGAESPCRRLGLELLGFEVTSFSVQGLEFVLPGLTSFSMVDLVGKAVAGPSHEA